MVLFTQLNLVIDIGNTATKVAIFKENELLEKRKFNSFDEDKLMELLKEFPQIQYSILCSVAEHSINIEVVLAQKSQFILFNHQTKIPIQNLYETPETLGKDRLAAAIGANAIYRNQNVLCIDIGTCIKYDFVDAENNYNGGAISPGISMRYKALKQFTDKLPLVSSTTDGVNLIGKNTIDSIRSGVQLGTIAEIKYTIDQYKKAFPNLNIVFAGGGSNELQKHIKKGIFASPNLVLYGLNIILTHNRI
jgi:type III pantothenate kinase